MRARGRRTLAALVLTCAPLVATGCARRTPPVAVPGSAALAPRLTPTQALAAAFDGAPDDLAIWSVQFVWADTGEVLFERQPDTRLLPASNMKLVTLAAAAQRLGWDYQFETIISSTDAQSDGVLRGALEVRGSGDPTFGWPTESAMAQMRAFAAGVRAQGVVRVEGDLVGDPDAFGADRLGDAWSWEDLTFGYAAPYAGLTFHENSVVVTVTPAASAGEPAAVRLEPAGSGLLIDAEVGTSNGATPRRLSIDRALGGRTLVIRGQVVVGSQPATQTIAVADPALFFLDNLRVALALEGVEVRGRSRVVALAPLTADVPLPLRVTHRSAPLSDVAVRFLKVSQNLYGEALQHALAPTPDATLDARRTAVSEALNALGVPTDDLQVADGSGLSRRNFVSARTLVRLLQVLDAPAHREHVRRALPVAGLDGTLERRLGGTTCAGRVHAKTGTLSHARALSGYLTTPGGREVIFSTLANNHIQPTALVDAVVDRALIALCTQAATAATAVQPTR